jgi:hypothetical protein
MYNIIPHSVHFAVSNKTLSHVHAFHLSPSTINTKCTFEVASIYAGLLIKILLLSTHLKKETQCIQYFVRPVKIVNENNKIDIIIPL